MLSSPYYPGMAAQLGRRCPLFWILLQTLRNEIPSLRRQLDILGELQLGVFDQLHQLFNASSLRQKWYRAAQKLIKDNPQRPDIALVRVLAVLEYFRCHDQRRPRIALQKVFFVVDGLGESQIRQLNLKRVGEQDVSWLDIPVCDVVLSQVEHRLNKFYRQQCH